MFEISIVIPAYNESTRLPETLADLALHIASHTFNPAARISEVVVVDDGSTDGTLDSISRLPADYPVPLKTHRLHRNSGKGAAVREGMNHSVAEWILIADADGSTPWDQLMILIQGLNEPPGAARIAIGSRGMDKSRLKRRQNPIRETLGKCFNRLVVLITGLPFKDTQCGFKLIHRPSVAAWLPELRVDRFAWDVEFLMLAALHRLGIVEIPVTWSHQDGSKVRPIRDGFRMVFDFIRIRARIVLTSSGSAKRTPL